MPRLALLAMAVLIPCVAASDTPTFEDVIRHTTSGMTADPAVQEELKLTAEQVTTLRKALATEEKAFASGWKGLGDKPTLDATGKLVSDTRKRVAESVGKVLNEGQTKRLKQLELQARGPAVFDDTEVQKALGGVTDSQRKLWAEAKDDFDRKLSKLRRAAGGAETVARIPGTDIPVAGQELLGDKTVTQLKKEFWLTAKNVLTNDQLNKWYELIGDIFPNPERPKKK